ncbi:MAG: hypothetical protein JSV66_00965 [Trueperaceae bacterium]|nr:MAG: hypothetical protein JSV66_00965 [Trueperaceae bacterium]
MKSYFTQSKTVEDDLPKLGSLAENRPAGERANLFHEKSVVEASGVQMVIEMPNGLVIMSRHGTSINLDAFGIHVWSLLQRPNIVRELELRVLRNCREEAQRRKVHFYRLLGALATAGLLTIS